MFPVLELITTACSPPAFLVKRAMTATPDSKGWAALASTRCHCNGSCHSDNSTAERRPRMSILTQVSRHSWPKRLEISSKFSLQMGTVAMVSSQSQKGGLSHNRASKNEFTPFRFMHPLTNTKCIGLYKKIPFLNCYIVSTRFTVHKYGAQIFISVPISQLETSASY